MLCLSQIACGAVKEIVNETKRRCTKKWVGCGCVFFLVRGHHCWVNCISDKNIAERGRRRARLVLTVEDTRLSPEQPLSPVATFATTTINGLTSSVVHISRGARRLLASCLSRKHNRTIAIPALMTRSAAAVSEEVFWTRPVVQLFR